LTTEPSQTPEPTETLIPTADLTASYLESWVWVEPGQAVTAPILLYHHVSNEPKTSRYYVTVDAFKEQMQGLKAAGYQAIPVSLLVKAISEGAELPVRPLVITFDDGTEDVLLNAFPVLESLGYVGNIYLVGKYLNADGFLSTDQAQTMLDAGWEFGSHGMKHIDLLTIRDLREELAGSKAFLKKQFGKPTLTFAYPYGSASPNVISQTYQYGYLAGMGLGSSWTHSKSNLFYLSRIEVKNGITSEELRALLPY
jgi:peptidoglycan/xylan/chitin deacetylase (PgdA/CDA1 family)